MQGTAPQYIFDPDILRDEIDRCSARCRCTCMEAPGSVVTAIKTLLVPYDAMIVLNDRRYGSRIDAQSG